MPSRLIVQVPASQPPDVQAASSVPIGAIGVAAGWAAVFVGLLTLLWNKLDKRFDDLKTDQKQRFDQQDKRFDDLKTDQKQRFDQQDRRLDDLKADQKQRFDQQDRRLDEVKADLKEVKADLKHVDKQLAAIREALKVPH